MRFFLKQTFTLILFLQISNLVSAGDGTKSSPFTIAQAIAKTDNSSKEWYAKGYIVGHLNNLSNKKYFYDLAPPFTGNGTFLLADNIHEINLAKCFPIQIPSHLVESMNLEENPMYWRKEVLVGGLLRDYFSMPGMKTLSELTVLNPLPLENEAINWNFFEDMNGTYTHKNSALVFSGGNYRGDTSWEFFGATWGDHSNDNKWGKASARIRLSEGATGSAGYIQTTEPKTNGIGTIRFWAGYYDKDNSSSIAIDISDNNGINWTNIVPATSIAKDWKEYQFHLNIPGNHLIRIKKGNTNPAGINVDNIRISDFKIPNATNNTHSVKFSYKNTDNGIVLTLDNGLKSIRLFGINGQKVFETETSENTVFVALNKGTYIITINNIASKIIH